MRANDARADSPGIMFKPAWLDLFGTLFGDQTWRVCNRVPNGNLSSALTLHNTEAGTTVTPEGGEEHADSHRLVKATSVA